MPPIFFILENQEKHICERIRQGDQQAFESVFKTYYKYLCAYANQLLTDRDLSEEIVQDLFFQLWQKRNTFDIQTSLKSYLFRATHNSCLNYFKHLKVRDSYTQHVLNEKQRIEDSYEEMGNLSELQAAITNAVDKLPPERKKVFMMIRYEERKYKEVAEILGISVKTVENQMGKAMQFLREALKDFLPEFIILTNILLQVFSNKQ
ncbi:MAG: RNA polymerase sigma-70 factor [Bacteroidetes bacterium HGW-Bacteroidetes-21]|nr:MAG: RNA polymerase sigma-70 factor [Bacteroidetes bacterium HGW-Bacteroidetes-21]